MQSLKKIHAWAQMKVPLYVIFLVSGEIRFDISCESSTKQMSSLIQFYQHFLSYKCHLLVASPAHFPMPLTIL